MLFVAPVLACGRDFLHTSPIHSSKGSLIMASIIDDKDGRRRIQFVAPCGSRKAIRLGKIDRKSAENVGRHVEALLAAKLCGETLPRTTATWLTQCGDALKDKLAAVGLIDALKRVVLGEFFESYILNRPDVKPATLEIWKQPCRNLCTFFGKEKPLKAINAGDAEQFKSWLLTQPLAPATIAKRLSFARTFFHTARKHKFIDENPFADVKIPTADVSLRQAFITRETVERLFARANPTWRTIIALARFGGLRCPSEVLSLEWRHVDWETEKVHVPSPKTIRYAGKGSRTIPMFPELAFHLREAFELAEPGATHVVGGGHLEKANKPTGWASCNLRTAFNKLIIRAGLEPWPRLFHNLRSSRQTELLHTHNIHTVSEWMGHEPEIGLKHYAQTTDDDFQRAIRGAYSGALTTQNEAQQDHAGNSGELRPSSTTAREQGVFATYCDSVQYSEHSYNGEGGIRTHGRISPTRL